MHRTDNQETPHISICNLHLPVYSPALRERLKRLLIAVHKIAFRCITVISTCQLPFNFSGAKNSLGEIPCIVLCGDTQEIPGALPSDEEALVVDFDEEDHDVEWRERLVDACDHLGDGCFVGGGVHAIGREETVQRHGWFGKRKWSGLDLLLLRLQPLPFYVESQRRMPRAPSGMTNTIRSE
jgi:hypothetical protein